MKAKGSNSAASNASTSRESNGKWSENDRKSLFKLANMIINFNCLPDPGEFLTRVVTPLLKDGGPKPGSIQVLDQLMEMFMIRYK